MIDCIVQLLIVLIGAVVVFLLSCKSRDLRRAGFILGACHQPLWFYATFKAGQWGIFALSAWYMLSYLRGARNSRESET